MLEFNVDVIMQIMVDQEKQISAPQKLCTFSADITLSTAHVSVGNPWHKYGGLRL